MARQNYSRDSRRLLAAMSSRMVSFYPALALALDSIPAAIMLGQLLYWHGKQADPDGWIRKSAAEMEDETAVTIRQQESARAILIEAGAIEYERRGVPPIGHYKINHDNIIRMFVDDRQLPRNVVIEKPQNVVINSTPHSGVQLPPKGVIDTEITHESTHKGGVPPAAVAGVELQGDAVPPLTQHAIDTFTSMLARKDRQWVARMNASEAVRDVAVAVSQELGIVPMRSQLPFWAKASAELYEALAGQPALIAAAVAEMRGRGLSMSSPKSLITTVQRLRAAQPKETETGVAVKYVAEVYDV